MTIPAVLVATLVMASMVLIPGVRVAQAQVPVADAILVFKVCDGADGASFDVFIDIDFEGVGLPLVNGQDPSDAFDFTLTLACGQEVFLESDGELAGALAYSTGPIPPPTAATLSIQETDVPIWWSDEYAGDCDDVDLFELVFEAPALLCTITNTLNLEGLSFLEVNKDFNGDPATEFTFLVATSGPPCVVVIDGVESLVPDGATFTITAEQVAAVYCAGMNSVTEQPGDGFVFVSVTCEDPPPLVQPGVPSEAGVTFRLPTQGDASPCTWTNEFDDPEVPNVNVTKVCVGEFDATFEITVGGATQPIECSEAISFLDVEPGTYELVETINGGDEDGFATVISCDDTGESVEGITAPVTVGEVDVNCIVINGVDIDDLLCPCGNEIDIDIDNSNTNTIGIDNANLNNNANDNDNANTNDNDNENKNDNVNTNTQDQTNNQDQSNTNDQSNNITSSPEVNIDFD
jgi:hypothetical protein